jgi:hypothetical protein
MTRVHEMQCKICHFPTLNSAGDPLRIYASVPASCRITNLTTSASNSISKLGGLTEKTRVRHSEAQKRHARAHGKWLPSDV